jgi:hypothetical protein
MRYHNRTNKIHRSIKESIASKLADIFRYGPADQVYTEENRGPTRPTNVTDVYSSKGVRTFVDAGHRTKVFENGSFLTTLPTEASDILLGRL